MSLDSSFEVVEKSTTCERSSFGEAHLPSNIEGDFVVFHLTIRKLCLDLIIKDTGTIRKTETR